MRRSARSVGTGCSDEAERSTSGPAREEVFGRDAGVEGGGHATHGGRASRRRRLAAGAVGASRPEGGRAASVEATEEAGGSIRRSSGALRRRPVGSASGWAADLEPCLRLGRVRSWRGGRWRGALARADCPRSRAPAPEGRRREARGVAVVGTGTNDGAAGGTDGGEPSGRSVRSTTKVRESGGRMPGASRGAGCAVAAAPGASAAGRCARAATWEAPSRFSACAAGRAAGG